MNRKEQVVAFLKENPEDAFLNYALAQEHISEGNDAAAEIIFKNLLKNQPDYVATYYHLGKLQERKGEKENAMDIYRLGIDKAKEKKEQHALSELQSALLELEYE